ncbi:MAG: DsbA family protein [Phenylobacterium sp.]|uniref:DsbA family protein n=1 Tax=Phenylobacterium sp. TaxID=1871053 RepID=UPI001A2BFF98|nr:DsbA family protein [Phenylobacterium sp.]MBJ7411384.1 DsbA family protein [Phenylobacterium sp.]
MTAFTRRAAIAAAAATAAGAAAPAWAQFKAAPGDMSLGDPKAPVHVVEYLSLTCPHCAHFHADVFPAFKAKYIDTGRVHFTIRELLTAPAQVAAAGFMLARCDGGKNYFKIVDEVFRSQARWQGGSIKPIFVEIAKNNGLTEAQFEACITDPKAQEALQARLEYATGTDKVTGTPTFFVNGVQLPNQETPTLADLDAAVARASKSTGRR